LIWILRGTAGFIRPIGGSSCRHPDNGSGSPNKECQYSPAAL
jgi:hypothetical protein